MKKEFILAASFALSAIVASLIIGLSIRSLEIRPSVSVSPPAVSVQPSNSPSLIGNYLNFHQEDRDTLLDAIINKMQSMLDEGASFDLDKQEIWVDQRSSPLRVVANLYPNETTHNFKIRVELYPDGFGAFLIDARIIGKGQSRELVKRGYLSVELSEEYHRSRLATFP